MPSARRAARGPGRSRCPRRARGAPCGAPTARPRADQLLGQQRDDDERGHQERQQHRLPLPAAGRAREEDHALGISRDLLECLDHLRLAAAAPRRSGAPLPRVPRPAGCGTPRSAAARRRRPRHRLRPAAPHRGPASSSGSALSIDYVTLRMLEAAVREPLPDRRAVTGPEMRPGRSVPDLPQPVADRVGGRELGRSPRSADRRRAPAVPRAPTSACTPTRATRRRRSARRGSRRAARRRRDVGRPVPVAAGDDDDPRAEGVDRPGELSRVARRASLSGQAPAPRAGWASRPSRAAGSARPARPRVGVQQRRAGLGDHHRIDDDRQCGFAGAQLGERVGDGVDRLRRPSIPTLTASTPMSRATARTWARIMLRRDRLDRVDADRVLGGDRGDRGHPVDPAGRERLEVGLDPGAAAGVRAGDRQHPRDLAVAWHRSARLVVVAVERGDAGLPVGARTSWSAPWSRAYAHSAASSWYFPDRRLASFAKSSRPAWLPRRPGRSTRRSAGRDGQPPARLARDQPRQFECGGRLEPLDGPESRPGEGGAALMALPERVQQRGVAGASRERDAAATAARPARTGCRARPGRR